MANRMLVSVVLLLGAGLLPTKPVQAGDGWPPFGAWAYGSGRSAVYVGHHRGHIGHFGHFRHFHRPRVYGFSSVAYWPSTFYYGAYPSYANYYVRPSYSFVYSNYGCGWPVVYQSFSLPVITPVYSAPVVVPSFSPVCATVDVAPVSQLASVQPRQLPLPDLKPSSLMQNAALQPTNLDRPRQKVQFVSTALATGPQTVPADMLEAADSILRAGGYREAATAYAQLSVRYGACDDLFVRRFVAQVASADFEQAKVIAASAQLAGFHLQRSNLPAGSLAGLGLDNEFVSARSEAMASQIYREADAESLATLGHWMHLVGDEQKSQVFLAGAAQLASLDLQIGASQDSGSAFGLGLAATAEP